ncbi:MAG TPA: zinc ribbon domain-containing protein [Fimbriimonadales bacterium]|jgi:putative FmdB family regulatory protein|nr:zinc ribbon domain-containing protein [Fimbriimonadales bacterium]
MPIYEFLCDKCGFSYAVLVGVTSEPDDLACPRCKSETPLRKVSRVARARSEDERLDEVGDRLERMGEPESYSEMRDTIRDVGSALDEDVSDEMKEMFEDEP